MRLAIPIVALCVASGAVLADEVYLKDAGSISGRIVEQNDKIVKVDIGDGFMAVPADRVERIVKSKSVIEIFAERAAKLGAQDVDGWRALGDWAAHEGFPAQARQAYEKVVAIAPNDAKARKALGFVQMNGSWVTLEESYRAKGYVKYGGQWMSSSEAQAAQGADTAYRAQRDADIRANAAENAAVQDQARKEKEEEEDEREREQWATLNPGVNWGGWGYGVNTWPSFSSPD